jgi:hypothetical protein
MRVRRRIDMPSGRVSRSHAAKATGSGPASTRQIGLGGGTGASHSLDEDESEMPPPTARAQAGTAQQTINKVTASGTHCTGQETIRHRQAERHCHRQEKSQRKADRHNSQPTEQGARQGLQPHRTRRADGQKNEPPRQRRAQQTRVKVYRMAVTDSQEAWRKPTRPRQAATLKRRERMHTRRRGYTRRAERS